jgi:hypothetical protein
VIKQTHEGKELKHHIKCEVHKQRIGYHINGKTGEHVEVEHDEFALWALMIVCAWCLSCNFHLIPVCYQANGEATYSNGPLNPLIEHVRKHCHISPPSHMPEIHVHVSNPQTATDPPPPQLPFAPLSLWSSLGIFEASKIPGLTHDSNPGTPTLQDRRPRSKAIMV